MDRAAVRSTIRATLITSAILVTIMVAHRVAAGGFDGNVATAVTVALVSVATYLPVVFVLEEVPLPRAPRPVPPRLDARALSRVGRLWIRLVGDLASAGDVRRARRLDGPYLVAVHTALGYVLVTSGRPTGNLAAPSIAHVVSDDRATTSEVSAVAAVLVAGSEKAAAHERQPVHREHRNREQLGRLQRSELRFWRLLEERRDRQWPGGANAFVSLASQDLRVEDDVAKDSPWACFGLYGTSASTLVGNTATGCSAGFDLDDATGNTLRDNTANANNYEGVGGNGFSLGPTASENLLADNTANLNNFGFNVSGSSSNTFTSNTANRNTSYGIAVGQGASFNTISFNVAHQNGELDALQYDTEPTNGWIGNSFGTWSGF